MTPGADGAGRIWRNVKCKCGSEVFLTLNVTAVRFDVLSPTERQFAPGVLRRCVDCNELLDEKTRIKEMLAEKETGGSGIIATD